MDDSTTIPLTEVEERVRRGAALLDSVRPGWDQEINLSGLLIAECTACVLGQLYGLYQTGVNMLCPVPAGQVSADPEQEFEWSVEHGFDSDSDPRSESWTEFDDLTEAWKELIRGRREVCS